MAETLTKTAKSQDAEKAQDKKRWLEPALAPMKALADESVPFAGLLGISAMELPLESHAAFLGDPRFSHSANNTQKARMAMQLQQIYGNQYVQRLVESLNVQTKPTVNSPDDQYEREANRVADAVTRASTPSIQRQADEKELVTTKRASDTQDQAKEEEQEPIQTKKAASQTPLIGSSLESRINSLKGGGQPLPESTREYFEPRFGSSFAQVRAHNNLQAADIAKSINAKAFTTGKDIVFGAGQYSPETSGGKRLLAHELTHIVQQRSRAPEDQNLNVQRKIMMASGTLGLARRWHEMTKQQRLLFVQRHFSGNRNYSFARRIIEDIAAASEQLRFDDKDELLTEVRKRMRTSQLMRESQKRSRVHGRWAKAFGYPNRPPAKPWCGPRVNEAARTYWGPKVGNYVFELSPLGRHNAFEALRTLFTPQTDPCKRTLIHCDYLVSVLHFRAFAESIGRSTFNRRVRNGEIPMVLKWNGFSDLEPTFGRSSRRVSLQVVKVSRREDLIIGDHVVLFNHPSYDVLIQGVHGVWRLENAILVDRDEAGIDLFQGHGYSEPVSEIHMKRDMRKHYDTHVEKVKSLIKGLKSRSAQRRNESRRELRRYHGIRKRGNEYRIRGKSRFCGGTVDRPLKTPRLDELPGLNDPCNPSRLHPVRRPVESS